MATIGLDKLYYAKITEDSSGNETYGNPAALAKAIEADIAIELLEAILYADDGADTTIKEFKSGTLTLNIADIGASVAADLIGATVDSKGVLVSTGEDEPLLLPLASELKLLKVNTDTSGFTELSLVSLVQTLKLEAILLSSQLHQLKVLSQDETNWMVQINTLGKLR